MKSGKRRKAIEFKQLHALTYFSEYSVLNTKNNSGDLTDFCFEDVFIDIDKVSLPLDELRDSIEFEKFIYLLSYEESFILLFKFMGYNTKEIMTLLNIPTQNEYYRICNAIKNEYYLFNLFNKTKQK